MRAGVDKGQKSTAPRTTSGPSAPGTHGRGTGCPDLGPADTRRAQQAAAARPAFPADFSAGGLVEGGKPVPSAWTTAPCGPGVGRTGPPTGGLDPGRPRKGSGPPPAGGAGLPLDRYTREGPGCFAGTQASGGPPSAGSGPGGCLLTGGRDPGGVQERGGHQDGRWGGPEE